jgi:hypothetical protein
MIWEHLGTNLFQFGNIWEQKCSHLGTFGVFLGTKLAKPAYVSAYGLRKVLVSLVWFSALKPDLNQARKKQNRRS